MIMLLFTFVEAELLIARLLAVGGLLPIFRVLFAIHVGYMLVFSRGAALELNHVGSVRSAFVLVRDLRCHTGQGT